MKASWQRAAVSGDVETIERLLMTGEPTASELLNSKDRFGQTALMLASMRGHIAVVEALVRHGAALNHTAKFNLSALMLAVINNHQEIVKILVEAGADRNIQGSGAPGFYQKTALALAQARGDEQMVQNLSGHTAIG